MSNAVDMVRRCHAAQSGDKQAEREAQAAARRVLTLRCDDRIVPYLPDELPSDPGESTLGAAVGLLLVLASGVVSVYAISALVGWIW